MNPSTTSFKNDENRRIEYSTDAYPPPPHYGGGYPPMVYPPSQPMSGYGGYPYGQYPPPYGYPYPPPPSTTGHGYAPPMEYPSAENVQKKKKKKLGMSKFLGLGARVVGGLLLGELAADIGAEASSFESFSESTPSGFAETCDANTQALSEGSDFINSIM